MHPSEAKTMRTSPDLEDRPPTTNTHVFLYRAILHTSAAFLLPSYLPLPDLRDLGD